MLVAASNNAHWCDVVCRSHGLPTRSDDDLWVCLRRSPPWYPDAVTLRPGVAAHDVLSFVDSSPGCSVKDSFADLDLTSAGFRVLFEARWIHRPPAPVPASDGPAWREVTTPARMRQWVSAHGGGGNVRPELLRQPGVTFLGAYDGDALVGGAVTNRSPSVLGVSNMFGDSTDPVTAWLGATAAVTARHPRATLVGYEAGASLDAARAAGFVAAGPLRVWVKE